MFGLVIQITVHECWARQDSCSFQHPLRPLDSGIDGSRCGPEGTVVFTVVLAGVNEPILHLHAAFYCLQQGSL